MGFEPRLPQGVVLFVETSMKVDIDGPVPFVIENVVEVFLGFPRTLLSEEKIGVPSLEDTIGEIIDPHLDRDSKSDVRGVLPPKTEFEKEIDVVALLFDPVEFTGVLPEKKDEASQPSFSFSFSFSFVAGKNILSFMVIGTC